LADWFSIIIGGEVFSRSGNIEVKLHILSPCNPPLAASIIQSTVAYITKKTRYNSTAKRLTISNVQFQTQQLWKDTWE